MLDDATRSQLRGYLELLRHPIELVATLDESERSQQVRALLADVAQLSEHVRVREEEREVLRPSFGVALPGQLARVRFAGLPMGHEFTSFVLAMLQVGGHPPKVADDVIAQVRALPGDLHFTTFVSLTCHNCPDVVQALNLMAVVHPGISHTMVDGSWFEDEVARRQVMAVPTVLLGDAPFGQGRMGLEEMLAKLDQGGAMRAAQSFADKGVFDMLIVGGGPAGAAAAIYAARKGIRTGIVAERFGGQVLDTLGIENFISVRETEGPKLVAALESHVQSYEVDVLASQRAARLVPAPAPGAPAQVILESGVTLEAKSVVLATGARWREMKVPGEEQYKNKGVAFCPHCDGPLFKGKRVAVIGGGNSGVEAAIDLAGLVSQVTLLEAEGQLRADAVLQRKLKSLPNVAVLLNARTREVRGDGQRVTGLVYEDRQSGSEHALELEGIFVQIGLVPNTEWLRDALPLSPRGEIEVDARGQSALPGIFAAGDCTTVPYKQIIIAMGAGATAALSAFDHLIRSSVPA